MPFPGLNIDNLPFFAVIAATAEGKTIIHDWVYENRAIYLTELNRLGARVQLLDPHRVIVEGPTRWRGQQVVCPPALRPAVCILLGMLAARGESVAARRLRDQPRLRGPGQPAQRPRRQHRGLPGLSCVASLAEPVEARGHLRVRPGHVRIHGWQSAPVRDHGSALSAAVTLERRDGATISSWAATRASSERPDATVTRARRRSPRRSLARASARRRSAAGWRGTVAAVSRRRR